MKKESTPPASVMLTEGYQSRLASMSRTLCGEPIRTMWISRGEQDRGEQGDWYLSGQKDGDFKLPGAKGCVTWEKALKAAESWIRENLVCGGEIGS